MLRGSDLLNLINQNAAGKEGPHSHSPSAYLELDLSSLSGVETAQASGHEVLY